MLVGARFRFALCFFRSKIRWLFRLKLKILFAMVFSFLYFFSTFALNQVNFLLCFRNDNTQTQQQTYTEKYARNKQFHKLHLWWLHFVFLMSFFRCLFFNLISSKWFVSSSFFLLYFVHRQSISNTITHKNKKITTKYWMCYIDGTRHVHTHTLARTHTLNYAE